MSNIEAKSHPLHSDADSQDHYLRMILELSSDAIYIKDAESRYQIMNPAGARHFGLTPEDFAGRTDAELFGETIGRELREIDEYVMLHGEPFTYEITRVWIEDPLTFSTTKVPYRGKDGEIAGVMGISRDVTERKRMEESLLESEERFRKMFEVSPDGVVVLDSDARTILDCNTAYCLMNGYDRNELVGHSIDILRHSDLTPEEEANLDFNVNKEAPTKEEYTNLLREKGHLKYITYHKRKDGSVFPVEVSTAQIPLQGKPVIVGFDRDITQPLEAVQERLNAERLNVAYEKEKELHHLKTKMMERVSHEFRTPLTVINTSSELLLRYAERMTDEQRSERLTIIRTQVSHLTKMLDGIASVVYDQFVALPIRRQMVNLDHLSLALIDHAGTGVGVDRVFEYRPAREGMLAYTDEFSLSLIMINLLSNAVKYSTPQSVIRLATDIEDEQLTLRIFDTGIGIIPNERVHIFEPFYRGSNFDERPGLGIGLTIVRNVVKALSGTITVDSVPENGSVFTVVIPLRNDAA